MHGPLERDRGRPKETKRELENGILLRSILVNHWLPECMIQD